MSDSSGSMFWQHAQAEERAYWEDRRQRCRRPAAMLDYLQCLAQALEPAADAIRALSSSRCLEIGVGPFGIGSLVFHAGTDAEITGVDPLPGMAVVCEHAPLNELAASLARRVKYLQVRAEALPFESRCFDLVVSHNVIDHCDDPAAVLREAGRVLQPDGLLVITLNTFSHVGRWKFEMGRRLRPHASLFVEHPWSFTTSSFEALARGSGFQVTSRWGKQADWLGRGGLSGFVMTWSLDKNHSD